MTVHQTLQVVTKAPISDNLWYTIFYIDFVRLLLTSPSGRVGKVLRPLINGGLNIELVHLRIFRIFMCSTLGSCSDICCSWFNISTVWSLNRLAGCAFTIFEHISRSNDTWSIGRSAPANPPSGTSSGQMVLRVCWAMCSTSAGVVPPKRNRASISPDMRKTTFWSLMMEEGRGQRKNSLGSVTRIDDIHASSSAPLLKELGDWKSSTNLFTTKASTQRPITRAAMSSWARMRRVISEPARVLLTKEGKGTEISSLLYALAQCHRFFRLVRKRLECIDSARGDVPDKQHQTVEPGS